MTLAARTLYTGCDFPLWMQWGIVVYGTVIIFLFINFYINAYIRPPTDSAKSKVPCTVLSSISQEIATYKNDQWFTR